MAKNGKSKARLTKRKSPATLAFVQKQNQELQACFGPELTGKLKSLTEAAMKAAQAK